VPPLIALSGARVNEVICLRVCDVKTIDGVVCISIDPDADRVKTEHSIRDVPVHQAIIDAGFLDYVAQRREAGAERLFFGDITAHKARPVIRYKPGSGRIVPKARRGIGVLKPGKTVAERLRRWLRELPGLSVGKAKGIDPCHAFRHRFKTIGLDAGIDSRVLDAICGHAPKTVGAGYGEVSVKAKAAALARIVVLAQHQSRVCSQI
jgi:integrase